MKVSITKARQAGFGGGINIVRLWWALFKKREPLRGGGDWTEDFSHENGNYMKKCIRCGNKFMGHKRRVVCRACSKTVAVAKG